MPADIGKMPGYVRVENRRGFKLALVIMMFVTYHQTIFYHDPMSFIYIIPGMSNKTDPLRSPKIQPYNAPWGQVPELELFVRMFYGRKCMYEQVLAQSMRVFWPTNNLKMVVVLNDESPADHKWATTLINAYPCPRVMFEKTSTYYNGKGHDRQQLTMFHADLYTTAEYVGFVDTDTIFVTPITPSMLFEDGKPVIIGQIGVDHNGYWVAAASTTALWLQQKEVMKCMSYFPFIIKVQHIVELRKHVEQIHNRTFDEVFKQLTHLPNGQFSIMCQFLWMYHRDEYKFYFHNVPNGNWTKVTPGRVYKEYYKNHTKPAQHIPRPRAAAHWRYPEPFPPNRGMLNKQWLLNMLTNGFCYSIGIKHCPKKCPKFNIYTLHRRLYLFDGYDWSWHPACLQHQHKHYKEVEMLMQYYNETHQPVLGASSIEDACKKWPLGYKFVYRQ